MLEVNPKPIVIKPSNLIKLKKSQDSAIIQLILTFLYSKIKSSILNKQRKVTLQTKHADMKLLSQKRKRKKEAYIEMAPVMIASNAMLHLGIPGANSTTKEKRFRQVWQ